MAIKFALTASNLGIELVGQMCDAKKGLFLRHLLDYELIFEDFGFRFLNKQFQHDDPGPGVR